MGSNADNKRLGSIPNSFLDPKQHCVFCGEWIDFAIAFCPYCGSENVYFKEAEFIAREGMTLAQAQRQKCNTGHLFILQNDVVDAMIGGEREEPIRFCDYCGGNLLPLV